MKNLKRALALALSSTMLLGMMVVGAGAGYSDVEADNAHIEAIEVAQAVGIMTGDDNGEFNPDDLVTRQEAAVIMANMLELDVADFDTAVSPFNDVADWAVPYVAACYADGIISGRGNGVFGGNDGVTAAEFGLMLMKALGYFQFASDFGDDWQLATVREASSIELYDDVKTSITAKLTRAQVAQMCLNALESDTVDWTGDLGTSVSLPDGTNVISGNSIKYVSDEYMGGSEDDYDGEGDGIIQLAEKLFDEDLKKEGTSDDFGRPATKWTWKSDEIGTYGDSADKVYNERVTKAEMYSVLGKDRYDDLTDGTRKMVIYEDGTESATTVDGDNYADYVNKNDTGKLNGHVSTLEIYFDVDTDNDGNEDDIIVVITNTYVVQASSDYSEKKETLDIDTLHAISISDDELDVDDFPMIVDVKEDDYLLVTVADDEIQTVERAEVLTGRVNSYSVADAVTIDGIKYGYAGTIDDADTENGKAVEYAVGENATVVLANGRVIYVDDASVSSGKYVFVSQIIAENDFGDDYVAKAYFLDGTKKNIDIKDEYKNSETPVSADTDVNEWFTYSVNDNDVYTLYKLDADEQDSTTTTASGDALTVNAEAQLYNTSYKLTSDTKMIIIDNDGDPAVYSGVKNIPTIKAIDGNMGTAHYVLDGSYVDYIFVDAEELDLDESSTSDEFIFVLELDHTGRDADDELFYAYTALVNGESQLIYTDYPLDHITGDAVLTLYADIEYNSDGYITGMDEINAADEEDYIIFAHTTAGHMTGNGKFSGADVEYDKDILSFTSSEDGLTDDFVLADECEIIMIACDDNIKEDDGEDAEVYANISGKRLDNECEDYKCDGFVYMQTNDDDEVIAVYLTIISTESADS